MRGSEHHQAVSFEPIHKTKFLNSMFEAYNLMASCKVIWGCQDLISFPPLNIFKQVAGPSVLYRPSAVKSWGVIAISFCGYYCRTKVCIYLHYVHMCHAFLNWRWHECMNWITIEVMAFTRYRNINYQWCIQNWKCWFLGGYWWQDWQHQRWQVVM